MSIGVCAYTGRPIADSGDGIWDDGEWISWDYINQLQFEQEQRAEFAHDNVDLISLLHSLVELAMEYKEQTNRYLDIFGELGELYAEVKLGLVRHKPNVCGSDGRLGKDFIEVKTISPVKKQEKVRVKRSGNFNKLYVVRISEELDFEGRMVDRKALRKGNGKFASVSFEDLTSDDSGSE